MGCLQMKEEVKYVETMKQLGDDMEALGDELTHGKHGCQSIVKSKYLYQV